MKLSADVLECDHCGQELPYVYSTKNGKQYGINRTLGFCDEVCAGMFELRGKVKEEKRVDVPLQGEYVRDGQWCVLVVTREDIAQHVKEDSDYVGINPQKLAESLSMDEMRFLTARLGEYLLQDWQQSLGAALRDVLERRPTKKPAKR